MKAQIDARPKAQGQGPKGTRQEGRLARRLVRLYPREWQERYGDEFLAMVGDQPLRFQQIIDILSGAIDARLSRDMREMTRASTTEGVVTMNRTLSALCHSGSLRMTKRDSVMGAAVMIVSSILFAALSIVAKKSGELDLSQFLTTFAFPASVMLSMPFTFMKGQPWKAQVVIIVTVLSILVVISYIAAVGASRV